ncbi:hypothetical protein J6590_040712 [Homalodisca vitripennis]|nr:hypothetical protein J6590_040712 [Homalodisca vitripennis]
MKEMKRKYIRNRYCLPYFFYPCEAETHKVDITVPAPYIYLAVTKSDIRSLLRFFCLTCRRAGGPDVITRVLPGEQLTRQDTISIAVSLQITFPSPGNTALLDSSD